MSELLPKKENKLLEFFKKKGFLLAIVLCFCTVTAVGYLSVKNVLDVPTNEDFKKSAQSNTDEIKSSIAPVIVPREDVIKTPEKTNPAPKKESQPSKPVPKEVIKYSMPLKGNIIKNFSTEVQVFSKTLNDYRSHNGIDIEAKIGDTVTSVASGKVTKAINDELYGMTIEVTDLDGVISSYSGLYDLSFVKEGNNIEKGDIIGKVGNAPNFECLDGIHLHFQMQKDGVYLNPIDMFK
ncbi:MAG: M23 family metallopeptidase [Clostridia bacterium]